MATPTGRLFIDDDSNPVPGGVTTLSNMIVSDSTIVAGSVNAKAVAVVDGSGNQITSFNGGSVTQGTSPWVISGSVTANQGTNPWNVNVAQVGGNNVVTLANGIQVIGIGDGTNTANVAANNTTGGGNAGNPQLIAPTGFTTSTLTLNAGSPNTAWFDLLNYPWISVEILSNSGPVTLTFQTTGDSSQTNTRNMIMYESQTTGTLGTTSTAGTTNSYSGPRTGRYFRISSNASGGNAATIAITFYTSPTTTVSMGGAVNANQSGTWTVQPGNTPNTSPWLVDIHATAAALADATSNPTTSLVGTLAEIFNGTTWDRMRSMGGISAGSTTGLLAAGLAGGVMPNGTALNTYEALITTATTTTVTSSTAYISSIAISVDVGGAASTITIQDRQGTPVILVNGLATASASTGPTIYNFQTPIKMTSGISIVTTSVTPATDSVWINYYQ